MNNEWQHPKVDKLYNLLYVTYTVGRIMDNSLFYVIGNECRLDLDRLLQYHQYGNSNPYDIQVTLT